MDPRKVPINLLQSSKNEYWEWRKKNNPFADPTKLYQKPPGFFHSPARKCFFIWLPLLIGNTLLMGYVGRKSMKDGTTLLALPYNFMSEKSLHNRWDL